MGAIITCLHALVQIFITGIGSAWLGAFIATLPAAVFFSRVLIIKDLARTSNNLPIFFILGFMGLGLTLIVPTQSIVPVVYAALFGAIGSLLYVFWYSRIDRSGSKIQVGKALPDFTLYSSENGAAFESSTLRQQPALLLFFRGNWCPLCMAQIKEIAASYQELNKRGVKVFLVSPQSEKHSQSLAKQFDAPMEFMVDKNLQAAQQLGLVHENGTPMGMMGYKSDTVMPTAILTDEKGQVIFADLTDNYRVRPEPQTFIDMLDKHLASA
jgi:peroxiredoxin